MNPEYHVASFIVLTQPDRLATLLDLLPTLPGTEIHQHDSHGKIIITIEADSTAAISRVTDTIGRQSGVLACNMVFHQFESAAMLQREVAHDN